MRTILALLSLLIVTCGRAQDDDGYFTLWAGPQIGVLNMPDFDTFAESFNRVNKNELASELEGFGITYGFQVGATYMLSKSIGFHLSYRHHRTSVSADFTDGSTRRFQHDLFTPLNGGLLVRIKRIDIQPRLGFCEAYIRSSTEYADGTVSFGTERRLNGVYRTFGLFAGLDISGRITLSDRMQLGIGAGWCAVSGSDYTEPNVSRTVDTETVYPIGLPTDWQRWLDVVAANELPSYDTDAYVHLKGSWYYAFVNLMVDLK